MKQTNQQPPQQYSDELLSIPTKICDGIFMADEFIAQDVEWLQMNQVTHIINCAGKHCKNNTKLPGVNFLTYEWSQNNIQNIIEQNVIGAAISFIEEAKKHCGSVLIHCHQSESRPFCILASYLMIRYQWNLFKTLQFLNSRKEDIELEPAFFEQLTSLHQKLQEKGLIKSRTWAREDYMSDEEIILTNTFLNSRKRNNEGGKEATTKVQSNSRKSQSRSKKVNWKQSMSEVHVYYPLTALVELNPKVVGNPQNRENQKPFRDSVTSKYVEEDSEKNTSMAQKEPLKESNQNKVITETNVTKRWAQLRQAWTKEKENNQQVQNVPDQQAVTKISENSRKAEKQSNPSASAFSSQQQKQQKISDRIQQKLNIIKNGYDTTSKNASQDMMKRRDHTPITGKKIKSVAHGENARRQGAEEGNHNERVSFIEKRNPQGMSSMSNGNNMNGHNGSTNHNNSNASNGVGNDSLGNNNKENQRPQYYEFNVQAGSNASKQPSKLLKPNTSSTNGANRPTTNFSQTTMNDSRQTNEPSSSCQQSNPSMIISQKQMGNKSVLIVKPNQYNASSNGNDSVNLNQSRNSKRKIYDHDNNKENRFSLFNRDTSSIARDSNMADTSQMRNSKVSNFFRVDPNSGFKGQEVDRLMSKRVDSSLTNGGSRVSQSLQNNKPSSSSLTKKGSSSSSVMTKMRSSSTRVSRKEEIPSSSNTSISKNYSYTAGKGKWKF